MTEEDRVQHMTRGEMKALIREAVSEELDARRLEENKRAIEQEMNYWSNRTEGDFAR